MVRTKMYYVYYVQGKSLTIINNLLTSITQYT